MKFLIDECLHTTLVAVANDAGYEAHHVVHLGLQGAEDHELMNRVRQQELVFVTNNALDFQKLFLKELLHPGLIIIVPNVSPELQCKLFSAVLEFIRGNEPINSVVRADWDGRAILLEMFYLADDL